MLKTPKLAPSRLCGWFNPFWEKRSFKEAQRLSAVTGIDHMQQWSAMQEVRAMSHFPRTTLRR